MAPLQQKRSVYEIVKHQFTEQLRKADKYMKIRIILIFFLTKAFLCGILYP